MHQRGKPSSIPNQPPLPSEGVQKQYVPPDKVVIEQFAHDVCSILVEQGHQNFGKKEVVWRLADFLTLIAELTAKRLNATRSNRVEKKEF